VPWRTTSWVERLDKSRITNQRYGPLRSRRSRLIAASTQGVVSVVRRVLAGVITTLLVAGFAVPTVAAAPAAVPNVVIVVGPAGAATPRYREEARSAAKLARRYTPDVTEIYSPNATWPAVKHALQGASLVIYMGHGNGWPSPYRDALYPPSQNGFGLNPVPDGDDFTHQYFGESRIRASVKLAKDAVVLLNHLCYASGNSEPGVPEGTLEVARQRVDNFAAGFIAAGASAVVAEAYASPNHMVRSILGGSRSIESAWRNAPSANGNVLGFESERSPGYVAEMDPAHADSGFERSIVLKEGLASADVLRGARGSRATATPGVLPAIPSLVESGIKLTSPRFGGAVRASETVRFRLSYKIKDRDDLPDRLLASVRWDPLDGTSTTAPTATATPSPSATATPAPEPQATPAEPVPPSLDLVVPERLGDVVAPVKVRFTKKAIGFDVAVPSAPGRYRLTVTLHDREGVAYDLATQAMVPVLIVRVSGDLDAEIVAPATTEFVASAHGTVDLWVANLGRKAWGHEGIRARDRITPATFARVVGRWVPLGDSNAAASAAGNAVAKAAALPVALAPGDLVPAALGVVAPSVPGEYLLVLDIVTPDDGSLVASGLEPTIVRVSVLAPTPEDLD